MVLRLVGLLLSLLSLQLVLGELLLDLVILFLGLLFGLDHALYRIVFRQLSLIVVVVDQLYAGRQRVGEAAGPFAGSSVTRAVRCTGSAATCVSSAPAHPVPNSASRAMAAGPATMTPIARQRRRRASAVFLISHESCSLFVVISHDRARSLAPALVALIA